MRRECSPFHGRNSAASRGGKLQLASVPAPSCSTDALSCHMQGVCLSPWSLLEPARPRLPPPYSLQQPTLCPRCRTVRCAAACINLCALSAKQGRGGPAARGSVARHASRGRPAFELAVERAPHRRRERVLAQVGKQVRGGAAAGGRVERDAGRAACSVPGQLQGVAGAREHGHVHIRQQRGVRRVARPPRPHGHAHERVHLERARAGLGHAAQRGPARCQALAGRRRCTAPGQSERAQAGGEAPGRGAGCIPLTSAPGLHQPGRGSCTARPSCRACRPRASRSPRQRARRSWRPVRRNTIECRVLPGHHCDIPRRSCTGIPQLRGR